MKVKDSIVLVAVICVICVALIYWIINPSGLPAMVETMSNVLMIVMSIMIVAKIFSDEIEATNKKRLLAAEDESDSTTAPAQVPIPDGATTPAPAPAPILVSGLTTGRAPEELIGAVTPRTETVKLEDVPVRVDNGLIAIDPRIKKESAPTMTVAPKETEDYGEEEGGEEEIIYEQETI